MAHRNLPQRQTYTKGLPAATRIVHKDPTDYYGKYSTLYYYPEHATDMFNTGWTPYHNVKGEPIHVDTYPEAKAFLEEECNDPQVQKALDVIRDPESAISLESDPHDI